MGLLDAFQGLGNLNPEQSQGLLAAAAQMLQQSGPSRTPTNFGQILGGGLGAYQQGTDAARRRKQEEEQAAQIAKLTGLKIQDAESDFANQAAARDREERVRQFYINYGKGGAQSGAIQTPPAMGNNLAPTVDNAAQLQSLQEAAAPVGGDNGKSGIYQQRLTLAQALRNAGLPQEADAQEASALKFQPKVKGWEKVQQGGKVMFAPFFEDGTSGAPVPLEVAEKLEKVNTGGKTELTNAYTGATVRSMRNTQSPDNAATVGASYANAAATRSIADATRDAATIQRNQATEMKLGDDYRTQSKGFKEVSDAYRTINTTLDKATTSPAATLAGATKFMKLLDPGSVVRESELGMALAASGVLDRATNYHNVLLKGRVLTPNQVEDFKNITKQIYTAAQQGQQAIDKSYRSQAEAYGLRPEMVVQELGQSKPATPTMGEMPKANASNKGRTLVENETGKRYRSNGMQWVEVK